MGVDGANSKLTMVDCHLVDYNEAGLLACAEGHAHVIGCKFIRTSKQAIEVREGGSLELVNSEIDSCYQGISAYGGARSVVVKNTVISRTKNEAILVAGSFVNAATRMQENFPLPN